MRLYSLIFTGHMSQAMFEFAIKSKNSFYIKGNKLISASNKRVTLPIDILEALHFEDGTIALFSNFITVTLTANPAEATTIKEFKQIKKNIRGGDAV